MDEKKNNQEIYNMVDKLDDLTEEEKKIIEDMDKIVDDRKKPARTNLLKMVRFKNKVDKEVFLRLPISDYEKEKIIAEQYNINLDMLPAL